MEGLSPAARTLLSGAAHVFGGRRHLALAAPLMRGAAHPWRSPLAESWPELMALRGRPVAVLASGDPFFEGNAAAHVALDQAGILHRFRVSEGGHDWIFWQDALPSALEHVGRIFTRQYGE